MSLRSWLRLATLLIFATSASCVGEGRPSPPESSSPILPHALHNATTNGLPQILKSLELDGAALSKSQLAPILQEDANARELLKYMVSCALPEGATVIVEPGGPDLTFQGSLGLAPQWADAPCEEDCQEWVSACLLARTNHYGVTVNVFFVGHHPALADLSGLDEAPIEEGAFFGNIFEDPPREYACRGRGYDPLMMTFRVCSQPGDPCGLQYVGTCSDFDGDMNAPSSAIACDPRAQDDPAYGPCNTRARAVDGTTPVPFKTYDRVISIYLQRSGFAPACGGSPWPDVVPARPDPFAENLCPPDAASCAGFTCANDDGCRDESLVCSSQGPERPFCTTRCKESADAATEQAECGGSSGTCLTLGFGSGAQSLCTRACDPVAKSGTPGSCADWQVCTGFWYSKADFVPDAPGCAPFCRDDGDCVLGARCNPRVPACGPPPNVDGIADGLPCVLPTQDKPEQPCRGQCYVFSESTTVGLCGSLINLAVTDTCPDDPAAMYPLGESGQDNLGVCLFRKCKVDADCTAPLVCRAGAGTTTLLCQLPKP